MYKDHTKNIQAIASIRANYLLSIVVPVYNEGNGIDFFHSELSEALSRTPVNEFEIIYVNDGSIDQSIDCLKTIVFKDKRVKVLDFSRNFGKEAAVTAGIDQSKGDAVIVIDSDLQDPPKLIPAMVDKWRQGFDIVNMRRQSRAGETFMKKMTAQWFYKLMALLGPVKMPENVGDFRLLSRRAVDVLKQMPERNRFMKGLFAWIGFSVVELSYERDPRYTGTSKWGYWKLLRLAVEGITSYTITPLRLSTYLGISILFIAFIYSGNILFRTLIYGEVVQGMTILFITIFCLGGFQLLTIGIAGEYIGRIFIETKKRPLYIIKDRYSNKESCCNIHVPFFTDINQKERSKQ